MKWVLKVGLCVTLVSLVLYQHSVNSRPDKFVIKFATLAPEGSTWMNIMNELNESVIKKSGGRLKFQIYSGGVSGDEKDVIRKIKFGMLQAAGFTGNGLGEIVPEIRVLELPFLFKNSEQVDFVSDRMSGYFAEAFEKKGFVLLGWAEVGFVHVFTNYPVKNLADLKNVKMWTWEGDPLANATFNACGISPIPLSVTDVLTSLQTGMIDGVYSSPLGAVALQWFTRTKFMISPPMTNATGAVLLDKKMMNKLPDDLQAILQEESKKYLRKLVVSSRMDNQESIKILEKAGLKNITITGEGLRELNEVGTKVSRELLGKLYSQEILNNTMKALQDFENSPSSQ